MQVKRDITEYLLNMAQHFPAITLTGPRQSGKSTLCKATFPNHPYATLEAPEVRDRAQSDPHGFLGQFPDGAIIDEVQRVPDLLSYLQVMIDEDRARGRWLLTGSYNLALLSSVSQSLAGRTAVLRLLPFSWNETQQTTSVPSSIDEAILRGGYPEPLDRGIPIASWMSSYVATYIERDVREVTAVGDLTAFQHFLTLCAGRTGQLLNFSSLAADVGITQPTAKAWLSILETTYIAFRLSPWFKNVGKRLAKTPKLHFCDTGLACWLLGITTVEQLRVHPLRGALFETWIVTEILKHRLNRGEIRPLYYYRDVRGTEADVLVDSGLVRTVVEIKSGRTMTEEALRATARVADALGTEYSTKRIVIYAGDTGQQRTDVRVVPWREIHSVDWL
ncbi:MAG: ATP-binding protein [Phycisphaerales bacterium]